VVVVGVDLVDLVVGAGLLEAPGRAVAGGVLLEAAPVADGVEGPVLPEAGGGEGGLILVEVAAAGVGQAVQVVVGVEFVLGGGGRV